MNKQKQMIEKRRILNQIRHSCLSGNRMNCFTFYNSEKEDHIKKKWEVFFKLRQANYDCWTEVIFNSGIRMDILAYKDGIFTCYEILSTESKEKFLSKVKNYPSEINIIPIKNKKDINNLEML